MSTGPSAGARLLAAAGAVAVAVYFGVLVPLNLAAQGFVLAPAVAVVTVVPLALFLGMLAVAPERLQVLLSRHTRIDLSRSNHVAAAVLLAGTLYFVIGHGSLLQGAFAYELSLREDGADLLADVDGVALFVGLALSLVILVVPVVVYVVAVHGLSLRGALDALGVHARNLQKAVGAGIGLTVVAFIATLVVGLALQQVGFEAENERALAIARAITPLGAFTIAAIAAVSEEVFFRGYLQPRVGLTGQAVVFALAHLSYLHVGQIVVTFLLGLGFGYVYRRTGSLVAPMLAHFLFNFVMLMAGIYAPDPV